MNEDDAFIKAIDTDQIPRTISQDIKNATLKKLQLITKKRTDEKKSYVHQENNIVECTCHKENILVRPSKFEETCVIFNNTEMLFNVTSNILLSLQKLVSEVYYPFTPNYDFYRLNYNHLFNYYPVAIVRAHTTKDIVQTIKFCRRFNVPIRARGGAHAYQPASLVNFGIILDQRPRDKIKKIDHLHNQTVTIEAGAILGPVLNDLTKLNLVIPAGTCCTNGLAGLTLGGGIGFYLREYGLTSDAVVNMKVVLANGKKVNVNHKENPELFFALRGAGGGNYGVITEFQFKTIYANWVTVFTMTFNFDNAKEVLKTWQIWAPFTNTKLTSEIDIFNKFQPVVITGLLLPGKSRKSDQKLLFELIKPLRDLNLQTGLSIKTMTLNEVSQFYAQGSYARPLFFFNQSDFNFNLLSDEAIDTIIFYMSMLNQSQSFHKTEINALGGKFADIPSNATAFPSRAAIHWLQYTSLWDVTDQEKVNTDWLRAYYHAMRPFFPLNRKYVNALDYDVPSIDALNSYYGPNLPELSRIKTKYDPTDFFKFEQSIPLVSS